MEKSRLEKPITPAKQHMSLSCFADGMKLRLQKISLYSQRRNGAGQDDIGNPIQHDIRRSFPIRYILLQRRQISLCLKYTTITQDAHGIDASSSEPQHNILPAILRSFRYHDTMDLEQSAWGVHVQRSTTAKEIERLN
jgi:hypothetical protein